MFLLTSYSVDQYRGVTTSAHGLYLYVLQAALYVDELMNNLHKWQTLMNLKFHITRKREAI